MKWHQRMQQTFREVDKESTDTRLNVRRVAQRTNGNGTQHFSSYSRHHLTNHDRDNKQYLVYTMPSMMMFKSHVTFHLSNVTVGAPKNAVAPDSTRNRTPSMWIGPKEKNDARAPFVR